MCPPKIETTETKVPDAPDPSETAGEIRQSDSETTARRKTGKAQKGSLQSLRVDLNVPSATGNGVGVNVPKG